MCAHAAPLIEANDLLIATVARQPFSRDGWIFELKYDGFRCLVRKLGHRVDLISREGNALNRSFPDVVAAVSAVPGDFVWDAELTVDDANGRPSFHRMLKRANTTATKSIGAAARAHPARLYVFDMLADGADDIRHLTLEERKERLRGSFENTGTLVYVTGIVSAGLFVWDQVKKHRFEGMLAKRLDSAYHRGRSRSWLKVISSEYERSA